MNKKLRRRAVWGEPHHSFTCRNSWWHGLWNRLTIETAEGAEAAWCAHEVWRCSCGKRWKVNLQWINGRIYFSETEQLEDATPVERG